MTKTLDLSHDGSASVAVPLVFDSYRPSSVGIVVHGGGTTSSSEVAMFACSSGFRAQARVRVLADGLDVTHLSNVATSGVGTIEQSGQSHALRRVARRSSW